MGAWMAKAGRRFGGGLLAPRALGRLALFSAKSPADFEFEERIGRGASAEVFRVSERASGRVFAIKKLRRARGEQGDEEALAEVRALEAARSPFVIELHAAFLDAEAFYLQLPFAPFGDLRAQLQALRRIPEPTAKVLAAQILAGLEVLHARGVVHCDVKPENILIGCDGRALIADLGLCQRATGVKCGQGTPAYLSPEAVLNAEQSASPFARDLWAFGVLLYEILVGETPFAAANRYQMYKKIIAAEPPRSQLISSAGFDLVGRLLAADVGRRAGCGVEGIAELKRDAFFVGIDWEEMGSARCPDLREMLARPQCAFKL